MHRRHVLTGVSALSAAALVTPVSASTRNPRVTLRTGPIEGFIKGGISTFLGIRYGTAARFQPPVALPASKAVYKADHYGLSSPQGGKADIGISEDCLFLNVWTPEASSKKKRPVMFYIHGGAYNGGSGSDPLYDGTNLSAHGDVVVVTVNHRLNVFGYLYLARFERLLKGGANASLLEHTPLRFSGNCGQMDLHLALTWVRDNIAAFGGDPDNVMVFGQSGGGAKIATMMATPAAKGLFHKCATMSGQQVTASGPGNASLRAEAFLKTLGLKPDADGLAAVQTLPVQALVDALKTTDPVIGKGSVYMGPVLDETLLFRHPFYPDAPAQAHHIPMIIGNTKDETRAFLGGNPKNFELTWDDLPAKLPPEYRVDIDPYVVIDTYRKLYPTMSPSDVFFAATTAGRSWRGAIIEAEERAKSGAKTYVYQENWPTPRMAAGWAHHTPSKSRWCSETPPWTARSPPIRRKRKKWPICSATPLSPLPAPDHRRPPPCRNGSPTPCPTVRRC